MTSKFLLDADIFIRAKNDHYAMDFCPGFWEWLIAANKSGTVLSIRAVRDELIQPTDPDDDEEEEDDLSKWVKADGSDLFQSHDQPMIDKMPIVAQWAKTQRYKAGAVATFLACADYYLIAYALAHDCTVVTHEVASNSQAKIKIPDACNGLKVKCAKPFEMLRSLGAKFVMQ